MEEDKIIKVKLVDTPNQIGNAGSGVIVKSGVRAQAALLSDRFVSRIPSLNLIPDIISPHDYPISSCLLKGDAEAQATTVLANS